MQLTQLPSPSQRHLPPPPRVRARDSLAQQMARSGLLSRAEIELLSVQGSSLGLGLEHMLQLDARVPPEGLEDQLCQFAGLARCASGPLQAEGTLMALFGPRLCLREGLAPLRHLGTKIIVAIADLERFIALRPDLEARFGPMMPVLANRSQIEAAVIAAHGEGLRLRAESRTPARYSLRNRSAQTKGLGIFLCLGLAVATLIFLPALGWGLLVAWLGLTVTASTLLRLSGVVHAVWGSPPPPKPALPNGSLPSISILVPLYGEPEIAPRLVARLERLDYPAALLEVILVLEEKDQATLQALRNSALPRWMRLVVVPNGPITTKPRAMNFALDFCKGSIIGIYDAEDAPDPDQLRRVAAHFAACAPEVACLQGALDYYNPRTNLVARLFTAEYSAWFRIMMPVLQKLRLPMPLGGTTLFLRREAIEAVGAWDAHNVTEDADLGVRLARMGYQTEMLATTTHEEANCHLHPWVKQRSRWIKGHLLTWTVHMRDPAALWRDLGPRAFWGYQMVFLGAQSQVLLAPLMWSFWALRFGLPHPATSHIMPLILGGLLTLCLISDLLVIGVAFLGLRRTRHPDLWPVLPLMPLYHILGAFAGWRAAIEASRAPFHWAKTSHGKYDMAEFKTATPPALPEAAAESPSLAPILADVPDHQALRQAAVQAALERPDAALRGAADLPRGTNAKGAEGPSPAAARHIAKALEKR